MLFFGGDQAVRVCTDVWSPHTHTYVYQVWMKKEGESHMSDDGYQIRAVWRRDIDIDGLARLVLQLALQMSQDQVEVAEPSDEEAA